ncbi:aromatic amino acid ammonia-lyase [Streptacidiphilus sp. P02-A3a]|uniref:aromatic amino acid ammonia-lyase n=1 Tax=Streptacidiphilus sp. P02-A3a TaxID=2704468 RepID=UPI0015FD294C|nr:aromatic amino acid ammonia-lyase [Streptacidiphilus sp. P02-A3a]QMU67841.1 aromatic amino acid lyase [Streptacidiphilus sp. P02-A3a]
MTSSITLDGNSLTAAQVTALARRSVRARVDPAARERMRQARAVAEEVADRRRVYGHTTGVGSNRSTDLPEQAADEHGMRLLRSHSGGIGPLVPVEETRAMLAVRLNQILGAGSALSPEVADRLADALASGHVPVVHALGSVGTADLSALAELGLALAGEQPWRRARHGADGGGDAAEPAPLALDRWDALPLMSSSALTIGQAALAHTDLAALLDRFPQVAALSLAAVRGSAEPYAAIVHARRPHPGAMRTAARMRALLEPLPWTPSLVQDPFGFRCLPQVHGAALDAAAGLARVLDVEINSAAENPLLALAPADYHHHGGFHQASLALALDQLRLAVLGTAQLSAARLGVLVSPAFTGLAPYLAQDEDGSSGIMITEYAAASAIAELRGAAQPVTLGHAVLSRGVEEHASFAATGARRLLEAVASTRSVLACELLAATRALRMRGTLLDPTGELGRFQREAASTLDAATEDRKLTADLEAAEALLAN